MRAATVGRVACSHSGDTTPSTECRLAALTGQRLEVVGVDPAALGDHSARPIDRAAPSMRAARARRRAPRHRRPSRRGPIRAARIDRLARAEAKSARCNRTSPLPPGWMASLAEHAHLHGELARADVREVRTAARHLVTQRAASTCSEASKRSRRPPLLGRRSPHRRAATRRGRCRPD